MHVSCEAKLLFRPTGGSRYVSVGPRSGRGFLPEPRRHDAISLRAVTKRRRIASWEPKRHAPMRVSREATS